jgi:hypothetical protein
MMSCGFHPFPLASICPETWQFMLSHPIGRPSEEGSFGSSGGSGVKLVSVSFEGTRVSPLINHVTM